MKKLDINIVLIVLSQLISSLLFLVEEPQSNTTSEALAILCYLSLMFTALIATIDLLKKHKQ